jgi:hypothetical protein
LGLLSISVGTLTEGMTNTLCSEPLFFGPWDRSRCTLLLGIAALWALPRSARGSSYVSQDGNSKRSKDPASGSNPTREAQCPEKITPAREYPENVVFEWPPVIGPESGGSFWTHPWKSKMTINGHAVTIRRHLLSLIEFSVCRRQLALETAK